jgi:hypothetical protein
MHTSSSATNQRTLHLVDIENLVGNPRATKTEALGAFAHYLDLAGYREADQIVVAANPGLVREIAFDLPVPCSVHAAHGTDGADNALLGAADPAWVTERFERLVIGSGDGAFAPTARTVRDCGTPVLVVSRPSSLSSRLRGVQLAVRLLPEHGMALAA